MARILVEGVMCERCSHRWDPRGGARIEPGICPQCPSPYWNKPRKLSIVPERRAANHAAHPATCPGNPS